MSRRYAAVVFAESSLESSQREKPETEPASEADGGANVGLTRGPPMRKASKTAHYRRQPHRGQGFADPQESPPLGVSATRSARFSMLRLGADPASSLRLGDQAGKLQPRQAGKQNSRGKARPFGDGLERPRCLADGLEDRALRSGKALDRGNRVERGLDVLRLGAE